MPKHIAYLKREGVTRENAHVQRRHRSTGSFSGEPSTSRNGCGTGVRNAMDRRADHLIKEGFARRQGQRIIFASEAHLPAAADLARKLADYAACEDVPTPSWWRWRSPRI